MRRAQIENLLMPRSPLDLQSPSHDSHGGIHPYVHSPKSQGQFLRSGSRSPSGEAALCWVDPCIDSCSHRICGGNVDSGQARWRHQGLPEDAAHSPSPCPPQAPAGQRPLPAPGLPEGTPAPGHAGCCPLGQQASEELWGESREKPVAPMLFNIVQRLKTLKRNKKAFFSGNDSGQWRLWFSRQRGPPLQESVP